MNETLLYHNAIIINTLLLLIGKTLDEVTNNNDSITTIYGNGSEGDISDVVVDLMVSEFDKKLTQ